VGSRSDASVLYYIGRIEIMINNYVADAMIVEDGGNNGWL
jgi:hypothetical protein